jgi:serine O-acetyltransferase
MMEDLDVILDKDPAPRSRLEVLLYPHIHALWTYRVAHFCYLRGHFLTARALSMTGRWISGIEIHPGAVIGRRFFIDHGSAVVIGETVRIGDDVMLYHQVTLGSVGWWRDKRRAPGEQRHPTLEDSVIIGTNVSVLGPVTIGARSQIGAHAVVTESVPPDTKVAPPRTSLAFTPVFPDPAPQDTIRPSAISTPPYGAGARTPTANGAAADRPAPIQ